MIGRSLWRIVRTCRIRGWDVNDYFFGIWAKEKSNEWLSEVKRDKQASLAQVQRTPGRRLRLSLSRPARVLRLRLHRRAAEL